MADSTAMKRPHHTAEQVIRILAEGEKLLGRGQPVDEVARHLDISESTNQPTNQPTNTRSTHPTVHALTELLRMNELTDLTNQP
jgi:hypothetical protein